MSKLVGQTLGHYRIVEKIGAGGMGEVYRALDPRLDREIALKILPAGTLTDEMARARLVCEARLAAKLSHPNILDVYGLGDHEVLRPSAVWSAHSSSPRSLAG